MREQVSVLPRPIMTAFEPKADITAYEGMLCLKKMMESGYTSAVMFMPGEWAAFPPELKRHFVPR